MHTHSSKESGRVWVAERLSLLLRFFGTWHLALSAAAARTKIALSRSLCMCFYWQPSTSNAFCAGDSSTKGSHMCVRPLYLWNSKWLICRLPWRQLTASCKQLAQEGAELCTCVCVSVLGVCMCLLASLFACLFVCVSVVFVFTPVPVPSKAERCLCVVSLKLNNYTSIKKKNKEYKKHNRIENK